MAHPVGKVPSFKRSERVGPQELLRDEAAEPDAFEPREGSLEAGDLVPDGITQRQLFNNQAGSPPENGACGPIAPGLVLLRDQVSPRRFVSPL